MQAHAFVHPCRDERGSITVAGSMYIHLARPINRENRVLGEKHLLACKALDQFKTDAKAASF